MDHIGSDDEKVLQAAAAAGPAVPIDPLIASCFDCLATVGAPCVDKPPLGDASFHACRYIDAAQVKVTNEILGGEQVTPMSQADMNRFVLNDGEV